MDETTHTPSALIVGASYAGLVSAAALQAGGWTVQVIERSRNKLRTGGGVVVQRRMAEYLESRGLALPGIASVPAQTRKIFLRDGNTMQMPETAAGYTAWDVLLLELERLIGPQTIERGVSLVDLPDQGNTGEVVLSDGTRRSADIVIAADGIGSVTRRILLPDYQPKYAGYVAWRGTVAEQDLPDHLKEPLIDSFATFERDGTNILSYEIPGENGETDAGLRRLNWVWYENVSDLEELEGVLTDTEGVVHRSTIGRGQLPEETLNRMRDRAAVHLIEPFSHLVQATPQPFVQAIQDLTVQRLVFGRTVLVGDAASLVRPHIGSGTAKAVDDAIKLAAALSDCDYKEHGCLSAWEHTRLHDHHTLVAQSKAAAQRLGLGWDETEIDRRRDINEALALAGAW